MRVLVVGGGGREHALIWKLLGSERVDAVACAPGNAGTAILAQPIPVEATDTRGLLNEAVRFGADLVVVGPEAPLAAGIVDDLSAAGLRVFGPTQAAARLEWSKVWAKEFLLRHGIPTARAEVVESEAEALAAVARSGLPCVIKADGLASGKGVWVARTEADVNEALDALFRRQVLGTAGARAIVETCLEGRELSVLAFTDGERLAVMPPARDYKRLLDGDDGPNTGGMGGYTRPSDATPDVLERVEREILRPTLAAMAAEGHPYKGVLYAGLMLTADGPMVLEFNCRFGDPETQVILPLLESDLADVLEAVVEERLDPAAVRWKDGVTCGVVLATGGYPAHPALGDRITGLDDLPPGVLAFHAGTRLAPTSSRDYSDERPVVTAGGRVLAVVASGPTLAEARGQVYRALDRVRFAGRVFRTDIGLEQPAQQPMAARPTTEVTPA